MKLCNEFVHKLIKLSLGTTARDLGDICTQVKAKACIIPKAKVNYRNLQYAFFYFESEEEMKQVIETSLILNNKQLQWVHLNTKLYAKCVSVDHSFDKCPFRCHIPKDKKIQHLYSKFKPA